MVNTKRLFIAEYEDAYTWTDGKRTILSKIEPNDLYLIFKTGKERKNKLSSTMVQLMKDMDNNSRVIDVSSLDNDEYVTRLVQLIKENSTKETEIYFLHMDQMFQLIKDKLNGYNFSMKRNYKVGRMQTQMQSKNQAEPGNDIFKAIAGVVNNDNSPKNTVNDKMTGNGTESGDNNSNKEKDNGNNGKPFKRNPKQEQKTKDIIDADDEISVKDLEKQIFGNKVVSKEFQISYTKLDNAKAELVSLIYERLIKSIKKLIKNINNYEFSSHQYFNLITTLIKSNSYTDFAMSYETVEPGFKLEISLKVYEYLYDEACYYSKVCKVLYDEDLWD